MLSEETAPGVGPGTRVRRSCYFAATRRYGCKAYTVYNHMYMPLYYDSPEGDYWKLVNAVTLWDVAVERQVEIAGPDAARLTQLLTPRDLSTCAVGQCKYVLLTDEDGGVINDPVLLKLAEDRFWLSAADSDILLWAKGVAYGSGLDVTVHEPDVSPLQLQGPMAGALAVDLFGSEIDTLKYYRFVELDFEGMPLVISRTGWSGERGYEIFLCDGRHGDALWERIMAAGQRYDIAPAAPSTIRRIEAGLLSYGADMTLAENPFELGLGRLIDLDQDTDFIGKAALARIRDEGAKRSLVGLELLCGAATAGGLGGMPVTTDGTTVGKVTSAVYSPRLAKSIALALVPTDLSEPGTWISVATGFADIQAMVVPLPFSRPKTTAS